MFKKIVLVIAVFMILSASNLYAQSFALGLKGGTLGFGVEAEGAANDTFGGRIGINYLKYDYEGTVNEIDYDYDIKTTNLLATLDWHPFSGSFRISGGVSVNNTTYKAKATSADTVKINDQEYEGSEVGTLNATIEFNKVNPYLGVGWDTTFGKSKRLGFLCDLGFVYQGSPDIDLSANGTKANDTTFQSDLDQEEKDLQDNLDRFKFYPVVAMGIIYRF